MNVSKKKLLGIIREQVPDYAFTFILKDKRFGISVFDPKGRKVPFGKKVTKKQRERHRAVYLLKTMLHGIYVEQRAGDADSATPIVWGGIDDA